WKFMHSIVTNNRFYANFEAFADSLCLFFDNIPKYKSKISSLVTIISSKFSLTILPTLQVKEV
ncbi:MAG: hypothetical protein LN590_06125, partial [Rickettsia endosymbiont of Glossina mortisans submortisans]|nr:hypothetical protein [Rickettsia endosymbiont of Glossina mortisans submortisans]